MFPPVVSGDTVALATPERVTLVDISSAKPETIAVIDIAPTTQPTIAGSVLLVTTRSTLRAFALATGSEEWRLDTTYRSTPLAAFDSSIVATTRDRLHRIDGETGTVRWESDIGSGVDGIAADPRRIVINQGRGSGSGSRVVGVDIANGERQWTGEAEHSDLPPLLGEQVLTVSEYGRVSIRDGGSLRTVTETEVLSPRAAAATDSFVVVGPGVDGTYAGVDLGTETLRWEVRLQGGGRPIVDGTTVFVPVRSDGIVVLDPESGVVRRQVAVDGLRNGLVPVSDGLLCFDGPGDRVSLVNSE